MSPFNLLCKLEARIYKISLTDRPHRPLKKSVTYWTSALPPFCSGVNRDSKHRGTGCYTILIYCHIVWNHYPHTRQEKTELSNLNCRGSWHFSLYRLENVIWILVTSTELQLSPGQMFPDSYPKSDPYAGPNPSQTANTMLVLLSSTIGI